MPKIEAEEKKNDSNEWNTKCHENLSFILKYLPLQTG